MKERARKKPAKFLRVIIVILCLIAFIIVGAVITFNVSPVAGSLLIRALFDNPPPPPPEDMIYEETVSVSKNISYGDLGDELFDLYLPADRDGLLPLIIWVHGGAFVGGDKADVEFLARALAFEGYAVACINYSRAPEAKYPTPVLQTGTALDFLMNSEYPGSTGIDTQQIFLAGDSAGAHIAAQFVNLQTNPAYRDDFMATHTSPGFSEPISKDILKGVLLYCGPYSIRRMLDVEHPMFKFLVWQTGWAYLNDRNLTGSPFEIEADIILNVTADFPPAFITDGNTMSFPQHARALAEKVSGLGVNCRELYFDDSLVAVPHEYQFDLRKDAGRLALKEVLEFLDERLTVRELS